MKKVVQAHICLFSANIIYGINYIVAKGIMPDHISPFALTLSRIIGALLLFWLFSLFESSEKIEKKDWIRLIIASIFGVALNQSLFLNGLCLTSPIDASIIMTSNPVLVMLIAAILLNEPITRRKILGIILGASGALLVIFQSGKANFSLGNFSGNIMIISNALSYAIYLVILKPIMSKYSPITIMKWVFLFGYCFAFPFAIQDFINANWNNILTSILGEIIYVVIAVTFIAYLLNMYALKYVKPTTVSIYIYCQPVVATLIATLLGKDNLTLIKIIAALLVFNGVYFVSSMNKK